MSEKIKVQEVIEEIKNTSEETLRFTIEKWYESTRKDGLRMGADYISAAIYGTIQKHLKKKTGAKPSLRDYQRCMDDIIKIVSVRLTQQSDLEKQDNVAEGNEL